MQREGDQPQHHPLVGFRRMPRQRQRVVGVVAALDIGDRQLRFVDRRLECHQPAAAAAAAAAAFFDTFLPPFKSRVFSHLA